jgi:hypothetical protein
MDEYNDTTYSQNITDESNIDPEDEIQDGLFDENDLDLLYYHKIPILVNKEETLRIYDIIKSQTNNTVLPLFDKLSINDLFTFLFSR